ncbi:MAG: nitroreductase family protein [Armatimonadetes bacterium]|nr:nitroreductase family protein [Armatimonadota bacterium]
MLEAIAKRCSVRSYSDEPVAEEDLQQVLEAALSAPSANNVRPWHIVVVTDEDKRRRLSEVSQWARFCAQSPVVLAFCGDTERQPHWWVEDCSAALENALIQAAALGLGTCWVGIRSGENGPGPEREELVREVLDIPDGIGVLGLVALGHPAGETHPKGPGPMEAVHYESW